jgi:methionyl-tRNA formyltransferase
MSKGKPSSAPGNTVVIASSRAWNRSLGARVADRTGWKVIPITDPAALTAVALARLKPRFVFFPHWSHIIPANVYEAFACVIFHMTDLPFGRGGSPLQNLIVRGHDRTKLSALRCVKELDAGPIYLKKDLSLLGAAEEIFLRADRVIEDMIVEMIRKNPKPKPQKGLVTAFKRRKPQDGHMVQAGSLDQAFDLIRMLDAEGYPSAFIDVGSFRLEFSRAARKVDAVVADVRITLRK